MTTIAHEVRETLTVAKFRAWLQTKPPEGKFDYINNQNCVVAQFLKETGVFPPGHDTYDHFGVTAHYVRVVSASYSTSSEEVHIPREIDIAARVNVQTYGAVLAALS